MTSRQPPQDERLTAPQPAAIPELVAQVYEIAPPTERSHILELLLRPLGVLSLVAVAHGIFASIRFRTGWSEMPIPLEELSRVHSSDVVALVEHAQQVSVEAVDGLAQMLLSSPQLAASAAGALLVALLVERSRRRRPKVESPDDLTLADG
ncbi:MAG: hypothetical protein ABI409_01365 [Ramlibacter sp.]